MIFDLIDYLLGAMKCLVFKLVYWNKFKYHIYGKYASSFQLRLNGKGSLKMGKNSTVRGGVKIRINNGELFIGDNVGFNNYCCLNCMNKIEIGDNVIFGQGVKMYDHDHAYKNGGIIRNAGYVTEKISIGNNVWIGSDCIILKGTVIGDNVVIAAGTIVRGYIPDNTLAYGDGKTKNINI